MRSIAYIGSDADILNDIRHFCTKIVGEDMVDLHVLPGVPGSVLQACTQAKAGIVIVDFSDPSINIGGVVEEIAFAKKNEHYYGVLFVGMWAKSQELMSQVQVFSSGVLYSFIKGGEWDKFLNDILYIGYDERLAFSRYARADNLKLGLHVESCASISRTIYDGILVDADFVPSKENVKVSQSIFPSLPVADFKLLGHREAGSVYPSPCSIELEWPFCGAWDEAGRACLMRDTFDTWSIFFKDEMDPRIGQMIVIGHRPDQLPEYQAVTKGAPLIIEYRAPIENIGEELAAKRPSVVILDLLSVDSPDLGMDKVTECVSALRAIPDQVVKTASDFAPVILVFNCETRTEALQKVYGTTKIYASTSKLTPHALSLFLKTFAAKFDNKEGGERFFKAGDPKRAIGLQMQVRLTSFTEHEITFICPEKLPLFSVLRAELPFPVMLTIIPPLRELYHDPNGDHYMALIHGIEEKDLNELRKLVNQMIYKPMESFTPQDMRAAIRRWDEKNKAAKSETPQLEKGPALDQLVMPEKLPPVPSRGRRKFKMKSKL